VVIQSVVHRACSRERLAGVLTLVALVTAFAIIIGSLISATVGLMVLRSVAAPVRGGDG